VVGTGAPGPLIRTTAPIAGRAFNLTVRQPISQRRFESRGLFSTALCPPERRTKTHPVMRFEWHTAAPQPRGPRRNLAGVGYVSRWSGAYENACGKAGRQRHLGDPTAARRTGARRLCRPHSRWLAGYCQGMCCTGRKAFRLGRVIIWQVSSRGLYLTDVTCGHDGTTLPAVKFCAGEHLSGPVLLEHCLHAVDRRRAQPAERRFGNATNHQGPATNVLHREPNRVLLGAGDSWRAAQGHCGDLWSRKARARIALRLAMSKSYHPQAEYCPFPI